MIFSEQELVFFECQNEKVEKKVFALNFVEVSELKIHLFSQLVSGWKENMKYTLCTRIESTSEETSEKYMNTSSEFPWSYEKKS